MIALKDLERGKLRRLKPRHGDGRARYPGSARGTSRSVLAIQKIGFLTGAASFDGGAGDIRRFLM